MRMKMNKEILFLALTLLIIIYQCLRKHHSLFFLGDQKMEQESLLVALTLMVTIYQYFSNNLRNLQQKDSHLLLRLLAAHLHHYLSAPCKLSGCMSNSSRRPPPLTLCLETPENTPLTGVESESKCTPSSPATSKVKLESMWEEYKANRLDSPPYFLYPPFTPEEEQWITEVNHPFKHYVYECWQENLHKSMQGWLEDFVTYS